MVKNFRLSEAHLIYVSATSKWQSSIFQPECRVYSKPNVSCTVCVCVCWNNRYRFNFYYFKPYVNQYDRVDRLEYMQHDHAFIRLGIFPDIKYPETFQIALQQIMLIKPMNIHSTICMHKSNTHIANPEKYTVSFKSLKLMFTKVKSGIWRHMREFMPLLMCYNEGMNA